MKLLVKAAVLAGLGASAAANASTFDFTYFFADGQQLTGSLNGTLSGTNISNISNLQASLDSVAFAGGTYAASPGGTPAATALQIFGYNSTTHQFDDTIAPVFSTVATQNNFVIADVDPSVDVNGANYSFAFTNDPSFGRSAAAVNWLVSDSSGNPQLAIDPSASGVSGTWAVTPVPLPAALPLLLSGVGILGAARRRRSVKSPAHS